MISNLASEVSRFYLSRFVFRWHTSLGKTVNSLVSHSLHLYTALVRHWSKFLDTVLSQILVNIVWYRILRALLVLLVLLKILLVLLKSFFRISKIQNEEISNENCRHVLGQFLAESGGCPCPGKDSPVVFTKSRTRSRSENLQQKCENKKPRWGIKWNQFFPHRYVQKKSSQHFLDQFSSAEKNEWSQTFW